MTTNPAYISHLLADARLPAGGHTNSAGLEAALLAPKPPRLDTYLTARLREVSIVDIGTAVVARHHTVSGGDQDRYVAIAAEWAARTPNAHLRQVARDLGRALARTATVILGDAFELPEPAAGKPWPRPLVVGAIAGVAGIDPDDLVRALVYDEAQSICAAALKLAPGEPALMSRLAVIACNGLEPHIRALAELTLAHDIPAVGAPLMEIWTQAHSQTTRRLFRA